MKNHYRLAIVWHGDRQARNTAQLLEGRFAAVANALRQVGIQPEPAIYSDDFAAEVHDQLLDVDAALVWVNPIEQERPRAVLDAMLRDVAASGVLVSTHPDLVLKMGTKEVLYTTRSMEWGTDTHLYEDSRQLHEQLPERLATGEARVLKRLRGNGGIGVWKVQQHPDDTSLVIARHAKRGSVGETMPLGQFLDFAQTLFLPPGPVIDQPYQERLTDGMVRCYLVRDKVVGFGHQLINALFPPPPGAPPSEAPQPGQRLYYPPAKPEFQSLKQKMERDWLPEMQRLLQIETSDLPILWDADFLFGPKTPSGHDTYVLCEINVSSVYPFPDDGLVPLAQEALARLQARPQRTPATP